jgi:hypothetical protein
VSKELAKLILETVSANIKQTTYTKAQVKAAIQAMANNWAAAN